MRQVRLLVPVHHRLRLLTFPMRAGIGDAVPVRHETVEALSLWHFSYIAK